MKTCLKLHTLSLLLGLAACGQAPPATEADPASGEILEARERLEKLTERLEALERTDRIVVDTARNLLFLVSGGEVALVAPCSTGSGVELVDPVEGARWVFDTPRGAFRINSVSRNPVWRKPDWAFVEEGRRPPTRDAERFEANVLGDWALGFGNGYFIHGTLYTRLIGENVTHGCIRLGDEDLTHLVRETRIGTPLLIF